MTQRGSAGGVVPQAVVRGAGFLGLWLILSGADPADLPAAALAVIAATWASLHLLRPEGWRPRPATLVRFALRFLRQSVIGGADVAWRAFNPRLPLRPGFVIYPARLPAGPALSAFCTLTSLVPGTVPAGVNDSGALVVHCLDVGQPIAAQLAAEETLLIRALGGGGDG